MIYLIGWKNNDYDKFSYSVFYDFDSASQNYVYYKSYASRCMYAVDIDNMKVIKF